MVENKPRARVGTSGWKKPMWRGHFYPRGLPQRLELGYAATHLTTLEINTTFHGLARPSSYENWRSETPDDFLFAVKGNKEITHEQRLRNPAQNVARFLGSGVLGLQEKLGPILWQTPPSFSFDLQTMETFLAALPHSFGETSRLLADHAIELDEARLNDVDRPIRHAVEVRHDSFLNDSFFDLLREHDVAAVITNSPGWPPLREITSDFVYGRLHGDLNHYPDGYDDAALDEWAALVNGWTSGESCPDGRGRDVFVYFDNPDNEGITSPLDAMHLHDKLNNNSPYRVSRISQPSLWDDEDLAQPEYRQTPRFQGSSVLGRRLTTNRQKVIDLTVAQGIRNVWVFGSVAQGTDGADSDIDLLVDISPGTSLMTLARLERDLSELLGCAVDVVPTKGLYENIANQVFGTAISL